LVPSDEPDFLDALTGGCPQKRMVSLLSFLEREQSDFSADFGGGAPAGSVDEAVELGEVGQAYRCGDGLDGER
jgi:hypothetical protein